MTYGIHGTGLAALPLVALALLPVLPAAGGCGEATEHQDELAPPSTPGPGVVFTYPYNDQMDVPTGARIAVGFTAPVDADAVHGGCSVASGQVAGAFCVIGPDGPVRGTTLITGDQGTAIHFHPDALQPDTTYAVHVDPAVLRDRAGNLPADRPLFRFHTRQQRVRGGIRPMVRAVNGEAPEAFVPGAARQPRFPVADFAPVRLLFSEPIAPGTVTPGHSFVVAAVDAAGTERAQIEGTLLVQGIHLVFDPDQDLTPGTTYRVRLTDRIRDLGGEPLVPASFELTPVATRPADGAPILQVLAAEPPAKADEIPDGAPRPAVSPMTGGQANTVHLRSPLIGDSTLAITGGSLRAELADPARVGVRFPVTLRKGQTLTLTGLDPALGGEIPLGLPTGPIQVRLLSDATGVLTRNPYRDPAQPPHDREAPVYAYLVLDLAVIGTDDAGNEVLNQSVLHLPVVGVATAADGVLYLDALASMELDLLGVSRAPLDLALRLRTAPLSAWAPDTVPPRLVGTYPAPGQDSVRVDGSILLTFSEPMAADRTGPGPDPDPAPGDHDSQAGRDIVLTTARGMPVDILVTRRGSTLVITPRQPLAYGTSYLLRFPGELRDLAGNPWDLAGSALASSGGLAFATPLLDPDPTPPVLTMFYPGAPCALTAPGPEAPGHCQGGRSSDDDYLPFTLPANRFLEIAFDKPVDPATLVLGTDCNTGAVRVEALDRAGACARAVPGSLIVRERGLRFVPADPWQPGQVYRATLIAGTDRACDPGEICGQNRLPLNSDPLAGTGPGAGGGPPAASAFTATPATDDPLVRLSLEPAADVNGNGFLDPGEIARDQNRVAVTITGTDGVVTSARIDQEDCLPGTPGTQGCVYLTADLPIAIGTLQRDCTIGQDEQGTPVVPVMIDRCVPVRIHPGLLFGTALTMDAEVLFVGELDNLRTGRLIIRLRERGDAPITGYIIEEPDGSSRFVVTLDTYMDAPDLYILGDTAGHDIQSKPVPLTLEGPVSFLEGGRLVIDLTNTRAVPLRIEVSAGLRGSIDMEIPVNGVALRLTSQPAAGSDLQGRLP